tara:strand:+ start:378 stop:977 length:600 start_codon:yes stop_codon:yes gene_type:complete
MKNFIFYSILNHIMIFGLDLNGIQNLTNWKLLQDKPVKIEWKEYKNFPISRSEIILDHSIEKISNTIQDIDNYPIIFDRVTKAIRLENDIVQIILDMPFPFSGRDYVIQYEIKQSKNQWIFSYSSIIHPNEISDNNYVRLPNACGIWILNATSKNKTKIIYAWNGELLGNFPNFGLEEAWITQGTEVLLWLDKALKEES